MHAQAKSVAVWVALALSGAAPVHALQQEASFTVASRYDAGGQLVGTIAPDPDAAGPLRLLGRRYSYSNGLLVSVETGQLATWPDETVAPADWGAYGFAGSNIFVGVEYAYDGHGRKVTQSVRGTDGAIASLVQYSYNEQNLVECRAIRMNVAAFGSLPQSACTLGSQGEYGPDRISRFTYDELDQVLTEHRAYGTDLAQPYVMNTYSGRQLRSQRDANGNRTELEYDGFGRLFRRTYPSPTSRGSVNPSDYSEYTYELNGNLRTERKRSGATITYSYDQNNRLTDKTLSDRTHSDDVRYDYDLRGLMRAAYFASNPQLGLFNEFDGFGRLESATSAMRMDNNTTISRALRYSYDADGNRTRVIHPDGEYFEYTFDGLNRLSSVLENGSATLLSIEYRPDGTRRKLVRPSAATTSYGFDDVGRLESFSQHFAGTTNDLTNTFQYNPASQVTQLTQSNTLYTYAGNTDIRGNYAANGLNQYSVIDGQQITYDANGNLTSDGTLTYTYDMENRLVGTSGVAAGLKYDPLGRLVAIAVIPGPTTHLLYDGDALVAEYTISGGTETRTRRYVHGNRVDEPWVQYNGSAIGPGYRRYLHSDHKGSVIAHSNGAGAVLSRNAYDAYGIPAAANSDRFGYTGQTWLQELQLNHYRARMYSPRLGRFLQTDPVGYQDGMNLYGYVQNDPVNRVDPSGMTNCPVGDDTCVETPESAATPGSPPPVTDEQNTIAEVVVTAQKDRKTTGGAPIPVESDEETYYTVTPTEIVARAMKTTNVRCSRTLSIDVGRPGPLNSGQAGAHVHGPNHDATPGPGDNIAARLSTTKAAFVMTANHAFMVRSFANGTYATNVLSGDPLSAKQMQDLIAYMQGWEGDRVNNENLSDKERFCP